jgi:hypothetical protein
LRAYAEASGWLCGKRLAPFLAELVPALEAEGGLRIEPLARSQLLAMSAATIDRRLQPFRLQLVRGFGATKPGSLIKSQVPVRTWTPWDEQRIGFPEIDLAAQCGIGSRGPHLGRCRLRVFEALGLPRSHAYADQWIGPSTGSGSSECETSPAMSRSRQSVRRMSLSEGLLTAAGRGDMVQLERAWQQVCACTGGDDDAEMRTQYDQLIGGMAGVPHTSARSIRADLAVGREEAS